ncbi:nucleotidyltransferase domain-containing protein [Candidatus Pacearchaeota archaeon]|nr:nucleotidyltransferase domain-containing protein [Candidatus Pacearchaeota archaeon]
MLKILEPYLENILGVYLYGSYARDEQREDSDIDILVISNKNFKIKEKGFEIIVLKEDEIKDAIKIASVLVYSALMEAKPIINLELLINLRKKHIPLAGDFKEYIKETKEIIKINEEFLSPYSIILRLRGIYIIENLLTVKKYSYRDFKNWVLKDIKDKLDFNSIYEAYLKIKKDLKADVKEKNLRFLLSILRKKTQELEKKIYD